MRASDEFISLKALGLLVLLSTASSPVVSAQTAGEGRPALEDVLAPGATVWITNPAGREQKLRIVGVSGEAVTAAAGRDIHRLRSTDVVRVRVRQSDSLINGALIGAGTAVGTGLFLCRITEPWENCRDDIGPMLRIGAIGAAAGAGIDALIRGRKTVFAAAAGPGSARLRAVPIVAGGAAGLQVSLGF